MNIIFFGNTNFSRIGADIIHKHLGLSQIITLPDRPNKRGRLTSNPMKMFAEEHKIPVMTVEKLTENIIDNIASLKPDFLIVEDYGLILPQRLLDLPVYASLNIHHSLLPKYRGPSPAPFAILKGEKVTGVTVMKMAKKVDAGDILAQETYTMKPDDTTESVLIELNKRGAKLMILVIQNYKTIQPKPQDESLASYTKQFTKEDGYIDMDNPPEIEQLDRMIRAYYPWPTAWTKWKMENGKWKIIKFLPNKMLQVEGKKPVNLKDFLNGYPEMKKVIATLFDEAFK